MEPENGNLGTAWGPGIINCFHGHWGYIWIMEKKMETTILGYIGVILGLYSCYCVIASENSSARKILKKGVPYSSYL